MKNIYDIVKTDDSFFSRPLEGFPKVSNIMEFIHPKLTINKVKDKSNKKGKFTIKIKNCLPSTSRIHISTNDLKEENINYTKMTFRDYISPSTIGRIISSRIQKSKRIDILRQDPIWRSQGIINKELNKELGTEKKNIIEYMKIKKNTLSENLLNKLSRNNENHLIKLDKICKKVLIKKEEEKYLKMVKDDKLNKKKLYDLTTCKESLQTMASFITKARTIQEEYRIIRNKEDNIFNNILKNIKNKYWNQSVERLYSSNPKRKNNLKKG